MNRNVFLSVFLFFSTSALAYGVYSLEKYNFTPGAQHPAPKQLAASDRFTLTVFVHPMCSCSQATLKELAKIEARLKQKIQTTVVIDTSDAESDNAISQFEERVRSLVSAKIVQDIDGKIAASFGAETSGQTVLYSTAGKLLFQGGITRSRGHEGDNDGEDEIVRLVLKQTEASAQIAQTPTFGCKI